MTNDFNFFSIYEIIVRVTPQCCRQNVMYAYTIIASYCIYFQTLI